jgi:hypothetical protein
MKNKGPYEDEPDDNPNVVSSLSMLGRCCNIRLIIDPTLGPVLVRDIK